MTTILRASCDVVADSVPATSCSVVTSWRFPSYIIVRTISPSVFTTAASTTSLQSERFSFGKWNISVRAVLSLRYFTVLYSEYGYMARAIICITASSAS